MGWKLLRGGTSKRRKVKKGSSIASLRSQQTDDYDSLEKQAVDEFRGVTTLAARDLKNRLAIAVQSVDTQIQSAVNDVLTDEKRTYRESLSALREHSVEEFSDMQKQMEQYRTQLYQSFQNMVESDRQQQLQRFDERLNDVVSSYIVEALDNNIDLGTQMKYIISSLESRKEEIKKDILL
ncbi:MAG: hypothetical protein ACSLEY_00925 [Candidatus Saccharimonadales bacterium]